MLSHELKGVIWSCNIADVFFLNVVHGENFYISNK